MKDSLNDLLEIIYLQVTKKKFLLVQTKLELQEIFQDNYL